MTSSTTSRPPKPPSAPFLGEGGAPPPFEEGGQGSFEGPILAALSAAEIACPPSWVAVKVESEPRSPPIGVLTAPMMQTSGVSSLDSCGRLEEGKKERERFLEGEV
jgi:hypothetical protein